jgi:hypothetical protein
MTEPTPVLTQTSSTTNEINQFLLGEFEGLRELKFQADVSVDKQADVLLTLVSALGAGLALLSQTSFDKRSLIDIALVVTFSVLLISFVTFRQIIFTDILTTNYIRAINRIRKYYAQQEDGRIAPYLMLPFDHRHPKYGHLSRNRETVGILNCLLAGGLAALIDLMVRDHAMLDLFDAVLLGGTISSVAVLQFLYSTLSYRIANRRTERYLSDEAVLGGALQRVE